MNPGPTGHDWWSPPQEGTSGHGALIDVAAVRSEVWTRLRHGADDRAHPMRLVALATVGIDHRPSVRLMVVRGVDAGEARLWFYTDRRAPKTSDLRANPVASALAFDPRDGVQVRISGEARLLERPEETERHWSQASTVAGRIAGQPPVSPWTPQSEPDPRLPSSPEPLPDAATLQARHSFGVIELAAETIDWLQVLGGHQRRVVLHASERWRPELVS